MNKRILYGGAAALAAYFWWASRSTSAAAAPAITRTPSTTPNGVGFDIGGVLSALASATKPATTAPDATVGNPATPITTGPAPANTATFSIGGGSQPSTVAQGENSRLGNTYYGAGGTPINDVTYVDRFDSINTYINTLDWSAENKAGSAAALANAANQFGVSQREIAIASGYKDEDIAALLAGQNVPRY